MTPEKKRRYEDSESREKDKEKEREKRDDDGDEKEKSQGETRGRPRRRGRRCKKGFLFGGSLNPVPSIPSVNSGPISIHSAGYIAEYTCFLLLFGLPLLPVSRILSLFLYLLCLFRSARVRFRSRAQVAQPDAGAPPVSRRVRAYIRAMCTT